MGSSGGAAMPSVTGPQAVQIPQRTVPTRAAENQVFVCYSNYPQLAHDGSNPDQMTFCGQSAIIGPDGSDLARATEEESCLQVNEIDFSEYHGLMQRNPYWLDRRPNLYIDILQAERY